MDETNTRCYHSLGHDNAHKAATCLWAGINRVLVISTPPLDRRGEAKLIINVRERPQIIIVLNLVLTKTTNNEIVR